MLEPLLFKSGIIKDRIPEIEDHFSRGGYVLIGDVSLQRFNEFIEIRVFSKIYETNKNKEALANELLKSNKEFMELLEILPRVKQLVDKENTQIGLYSDYGSGSVRLCTINDEGVPDYFTFSLIK